MNAEYILVARKLLLAAGGTATLALEVGTPYRNYTAWAIIDHPVVALSPDVDIQPLFGGENDGLVVNITDNNPTKIFQITAEEVRPPTRGIKKHPDDASPPVALKSELLITNSHATLDVGLTVYMMASANIGGA